MEKIKKFSEMLAEAERKAHNVMDKSNKIIIYGAGLFGQHIFENYFKMNGRVLFFIDDYKTGELCDLPIGKPAEINKYPQADITIFTCGNCRSLGPLIDKKLRWKNSDSVFLAAPVVQYEMLMSIRKRMLAHGLAPYSLYSSFYQYLHPVVPAWGERLLQRICFGSELLSNVFSFIGTAQSPEALEDLFEEIKVMGDSHKENEILVLGDSHAGAFLNEKLSEKYPNVFFVVVPVGAASAAGLGNPDSISRANMIYNDALSDFRGRKVIVKLGEVDMRSVIWYRAKKHKKNVSLILHDIESTYMRFIKSVSEKFETIVVSAPLPTIGDNIGAGESASPETEIYATQLERTRLTIEFNNSMENYCTLNQIKYVNLDSRAVGAKGIVKKEFIRKELNDCHYNFDAYAELLAEGLEGVI